MATLPKVGAACLLGYAAGADAANNPLPKVGLAALACTIGSIFPSYIMAPPPQGSETADQPPVITSRCIIPIKRDNLQIGADLDEADCAALQKSLEGMRDPMTENAFRVLGETVGISADNRLSSENIIGPSYNPYSAIQPLTSYVEPKDLPKSAMWGIDKNGKPFLVVKYTYADEISKANKCATMYFQHSVAPGQLLTASFPHWCKEGPLNTFVTYNPDADRSAPYRPYNRFTNNLGALLKGEEVPTEEGVTLTLAPPEPAAPAAPVPEQAAEKPAEMPAVASSAPVAKEVDPKKE